jgi:hypothetical protein
MSKMPADDFHSQSLRPSSVLLLPFQSSITNLKNKLSALALDLYEQNQSNTIFSIFFLSKKFTR